MSQILVLGGVSLNTMVFIDAFPEPRPQTIHAGSYHEAVGSTGAGKILNLARLGLDVSFHAMLGADEAGRVVESALRTAGIDFFYDVDPAGTQRHVNLMDTNGRRISIFLNGGTFDPQVDAERIRAAITAADLVVVNIRNYCRRFLPFIRAHNKPIWTDIHDYDGRNPYHRDFIDAADVVHMSSDQMPTYRPFMESLVAAGKELVVCTHGRDGASALTPESGWIDVPALTDFPMVDTNGAGDSFFAGLLYGHVLRLPLETSLRLASVVAGLCVTSRELALPSLSPARVAAEYARIFSTSLLA